MPTTVTKVFNAKDAPLPHLIEKEKQGAEARKERISRLERDVARLLTRLTDLETVVFEQLDDDRTDV